MGDKSHALIDSWQPEREDRISDNYNRYVSSVLLWLHSEGQPPRVLSITHLAWSRGGW